MIATGPRRTYRARAAWAAVLLILVSACTSAGDSGSTAPADPVAEVTALATAWQTGDLAAAGNLTTNPAVANQAFGKVTEDLKPKSLTVVPGTVVRSGDTTATSTSAVTWVLSNDEIWNYDVTWSWVHQSGRWLVTWSSTDIHPQLGPQQSIVLRTTDNEAGSLVDRDNNQIVSPVRVFSVVALPGEIADPAATAKALVTLLKKFEPDLKEADIVAGIKDATDDQGYTVLNLRETDFNTVQTALEQIAGISTPSSVRQLPPTKDFAKAVLAEVTPVAEGMTGGTPGWRIVTIDGAGAEVATLKESEAEAGSNIALTLDVKMQQAAETALATVPEAAMLVAIQPSTGEILTVAQNSAANDLGSLSLTGRYPPGSIFKIVTAAAGMDGATRLTAASQVECPGTKTFDFRPVRNEFEFDLGAVDLKTAFAKSCNTTFAQVAFDLPNDALNKSAKSFGIGLDFVVPGITTLTGQAPVADSDTQRAEDGFGQGVILASAFSGALMAATVANGKMPMPSLIRGTETTVDQKAPDLPAATVSGLRTLMRAVVTDGTATLLDPLGEVYAKTGTAEFSNEAGEIHAHAWTVGYRGDVAFAALIVGGESSKRTNQVVSDFLTAVDAG